MNSQKINANGKERSLRKDAEDGRNRFLDAADKVYISKGYEGTTIRAITKEAKTSLARFSLHWKSKEDLFEDVFARHFNPLHEAQNQRLNEIEAQNLKPYDKIRAIIDAFLSPALSKNSNNAEKNLSHKVYCHALVDPSPAVSIIVSKLIKDLESKLTFSIRSVFAHLDDATFFLLYTTIMGAYLQPQIFSRQFADALGIPFEKIDWNQASSIIAKLLVDGIASQLEK